MAREWLKEAIFYEIYPQSFKDTNADGIGDFNGIIEKLDYIKDLGFNAIWMNPCFESPFGDAGYDVADYFKAAPRYGTNEDLKRLFKEVHARGMHIILDLVPGHTSTECKWFKASCKADRNDYTDRYIWTNSVWENGAGTGNTTGWLGGISERDGCALLNFFAFQPALNYGFAYPDPTCPWQQTPDAPGPMGTRAAIKEVMRFWLGMGCDGFRVDMAGSLVKNDPDSKATIALWQDFRKFLDKEFPEAAIISEWGEPDKSLKGGFHMDFVLHFGPSHYLDLFRTAQPYFSAKGEGDAKEFFDLYTKNLRLAKNGGGLICIPSGNHDMDRMARTLDEKEMKLAFMFLLTMPGVPFVYYGDEIGMHYVENLKSVEGGYGRTGSRSPMQWDNSTNAGFSSAPSDMLYIKQDSSRSKINVENEERDENSLLNTVKKLISLRRENAALMNTADFKILYCEKGEYPLIYARETEGEKIIVALNPSGKNASAEIELPIGNVKVLSVMSDGVLKNGGEADIRFLREGKAVVSLKPQSATLLKV